jgi:DNA repair exonuclease SbcCD ATPase subunit
MIRVASAVAGTRRPQVKGETMNDIAELERRIAYAMERIAKGIEALDRAAPAPAANLAVQPDADEVQALRAQLSEERLANAQLEERVRAIKQKQDQQAAQAAAELAATRDSLTRLDAELSQLRRVNAQLQASNAALRAANETGVGEPHLINRSMLAELDSLRAARLVDLAEAQAIKAAISPLLDSKEEAN